jgi:NADPH:quinone reductase-like Zn-dependent oxidoreductase
MRALVVDRSEPGGLRVADVPEPVPAPNQAVVEVLAVSVNRGEARRAASAPDGWRPGWDLSGIVRTAPTDGSGPPEGTRVVGLVREAAWAERVAVPSVDLAPIPDTLEFGPAATLPVAGLTALRAIGLGGRLLGRKALITGASGGVGRFAIQLAAMSGACVAAIAGSRERGEGLGPLGADRVLTGIDQATGPYDLILESVGGASLGRALELVRPGGVIVSYGNSSGEPTTFDVSRFYGPGSGATLYAFLIFEELRRAGGAKRDLVALAALLDEGSLSAEVAMELDWSSAGRAIEALMARRVAGKAVLRVQR